MTEELLRATAELLYAISRGDERQMKDMLVHIYNLILRDLPTDFIVDLRALCTGELLDRGVEV